MKGNYRLFNNSYKERYIYKGVVISGYHHHAIMVNFNNGYYLTSLLEGEYNTRTYSLFAVCPDEIYI